MTEINKKLKRQTPMHKVKPDLEKTLKNYCHKKNIRSLETDKLKSLFEITSPQKYKFKTEQFK